MTQFGIDVSADDIVETLSFFDSWEDRYKYIIDLAKKYRQCRKIYALMITSCAVAKAKCGWCTNCAIIYLFFQADSDAFIVKGLLGIVLAAYNGKTTAEILAVDIEDYFERLHLLQHLSSTRGNGLKSMVKRIQDTAASH